LQALGRRLDRETDGSWVARALAEHAAGAPSVELLVLDSARIRGQIDSVRRAFGPIVHHIHLSASEQVLQARYEARAAERDRETPFAKARSHPTERQVEQLSKIADVVVDTQRCTAEDVLVRATALLKLYPKSVTPLVDVLVGGQYGSEGKGNIVGHIAPEYDLLVRVGGPNAGHQVFDDPPQKYYHIPSGTERAPGASLLLGAGAIIKVDKFLRELQEHKVGPDRLAIDPQAMIIEDQDIEIEKEALKSISSTAQGVGSATARKVMGRGDYLKGKLRLAKDVPELGQFIADAQSILERAYLEGQKILLEGTQGTSLSLHHSLYPFCTSRDTTVSGCLADAGIAPSRVRKAIMVCRTYPIRVGGPSGEMGKELQWDEIAARSGIDVGELKEREITTTTRRPRRIAEFDWVQLRRSALLNAPTDIAITFADYLGIDNREAFRFEQLNEATLRFIEEVERVTGVPVTMVSTNFSLRNVIDRRAW
jgi:adenylosuccinate synthase